jgi:hypothetical protein
VTVTQYHTKVLWPFPLLLGYKPGLQGVAVCMCLYKFLYFGPKIIHVFALHLSLLKLRKKSYRDLLCFEHSAYMYAIGTRSCVTFYAQRVFLQPFRFGFFIEENSKDKKTLKAHIKSTLIPLRSLENIKKNSTIGLLVLLLHRKINI